MNFSKLAREFKYKRRKGNLSLHQWNGIKNQFNPNIPIRPSTKWAPNEIEELSFDLEIFLTHLGLLQDESMSDTGNPDVKEYYNLVLNWTQDNNDSTVKAMKQIERKLRLEKGDLLNQSLVTMHRAYDFYPDSIVFNSETKSYVEEYLSDDKHVPNNVHTFNRRTIRLLASQFAKNAKNLKGREYSTPPVSMSNSPMGSKINDVRNITDVLKICPLTEELAYNMTLVNNGLKSIGKDILPFSTTDTPIGELSDVHIGRILNITPAMRMIGNPGKLRPIFVSNDVYDVVLDPFKHITNMFYKGLSSSYSSKKITDGQYLNVDLPSNVRKAFLASNKLFKSSCCNSDLTKATDKIFMAFQQNLMEKLLHELQRRYPDAIAQVENHFGIDNLIPYLENCLDIISKTFIHFSYSEKMLNGSEQTTFGLKRPKFGQCQGQRGSFDLLHLTHTAVVLDSIYINYPSIKLDVRDLPFVLNGDDGVIPECVMHTYDDIWTQNGDTGIKSEEKSTSVSTDFVEFCKQFVRFDKNDIQPLNGLRFPSLVKYLNSPHLLIEMGNRYDITDIYKQIRLFHNNISKRDIVIPRLEYDIIQFEHKGAKILKLRNLLLRLLAKYSLSLVTDTALIRMVRHHIDKHDYDLNVFDREHLYPRDEVMDAYDWSSRIGLFPILKKYGVTLDGVMGFDPDQLSVDIGLTDSVPMDILEVARIYDQDIYHQLMTGNIIFSGSNIVRDTMFFDVEFSVEPQLIKIAPNIEHQVIRFR